MQAEVDDLAAPRIRVLGRFPCIFPARQGFRAQRRVRPGLPPPRPVLRLQRLGPANRDPPNSRGDPARDSGARRLLSFLGDSSDRHGMRRQPSIWSIVWRDSTCWQITSIAATVFVLALLIKLTGTMPGGRGKPDVPVDPEFASRILAHAVAAALLLSAIVAWRVARIRSLFDRGLEIEATVQKVKHMRGRTMLKLELEHAGITYRVRNTFQRGWRTLTFAEGSRISVLVDPLNPKHAVPVALYAEPGDVAGAGPAGSVDRAASADFPAPPTTLPSSRS